jgi:hypothetical protein
VITSFIASRRMAFRRRTRHRRPGPALRNVEHFWIALFSGMFLLVVADDVNEFQILSCKLWKTNVIEKTKRYYNLKKVLLRILVNTENFLFVIVKVRIGCHFDLKGFILPN